MTASRQRSTSLSGTGQFKDLRRLGVFSPFLSADLYYLLSLHADADISYRRVGEVLQSIEIGAGRRRQVGQTPHSGERLLPPGESLVDGLDPVDPLDVGGHAVDHLAVQAIADPDPDLREGVQHVELGDGEPGEPIHP